MSCYYQNHRDMLVLQCDACTKSVDLYKGETDRTLANAYIRENGWKTKKIKGQWVHLCQECVMAIEKKHRERFIDEYADWI